MKRLRLLILFLMPIFILSAALREYTPGAFEILDSTERKPARTAVLIMSPRNMGDEYPHCRWQLGKKAWEQYMNSLPNIDCYFLQTKKLREGASEQTWIEGNTIYVGDSLDEDPGILLSKTIAALEKILPEYTHFFRTNANAFVNLKLLNEYAETHHQSMFTGPLWQQPFWHLLGYGVLFSADVATHIVNEYRRLEGNYMVSCHVPEDYALTSLATGIFPHYDYVKQNNLQIGFKKEDLEFTCCPTLPLGVRQLMCGSSLTTTRLSLYGVQLWPLLSVEETIDYCSRGMNSAILYRIHSGLDLDKLAEVYEYLLNTIYPELPKFDLVEYANSLPTIRADNY